MKQKLSFGFIVFLLILFVDGLYSFIDIANTFVSTQTSVPSKEPEVNLENVDSEVVVVKRVIDGDTIELDSGEKVRYIGIDTPETKHPIKGVECYGKASSQKNSELVEGKTVRLEKDISQVDRYGRLLRYVYLHTGETEINGSVISTNSAEIFVNEYLVREGFAKASSYPPDIKYQDIFREAESEARELQKGLWGEGCN